MSALQQQPTGLNGLYIRNQWVLVDPNDKEPVNTDRYRIDAHDPRNHMDFLTASVYAQSLGLLTAFVLTDNDPFYCIDLDHIYDANGQYKQHVTEVFAWFPNAAKEISMSGTGCHIWGTGRITCEHRKKVKLPDGNHIEYYQTLRYIIVTGNGLVGDCQDTSGSLEWLYQKYLIKETETGEVIGWSDTPREDWDGPTDDDQLIEKALASSSKIANFLGVKRASFKDLWEANPVVLGEIYPPINPTDPFDRSAADAALSSHLAFWTGCNPERIWTLVQRSALMRDKWKRGDGDYRRDTILGACRHCKDVYGGHRVREEKGTETGEGGSTDGSYGTFLSLYDQEKYFAGITYVMDKHRMFDARSGDLMKPEQFNAFFGGYRFMKSFEGSTSTDSAFDAFTRSSGVVRPKVQSATFQPQLKPGEIIKIAGRTYVNTFVPSNVPSIEGDASPFVDLVSKLTPDQRDFSILMSFMAAVVQYPGVKFQWCPVVQGCEGNGKTALLRVLANAVGWHYVHLPEPESMLKSDFNSWIERRLFIGIEEIRVQGRWEFMDLLKPYVTNDRMQVQAKGQDQTTGENVANFLLLSNHPDCIIKTMNDRRYAAFYTPQQNASDLAQWGMTDQYFTNLYNWLKQDGYAICTHYLRNFPIDPQFNPAGICQRAPVTTSTNQMIYESLGQAEQEILAAIDEDRPGFRGGFISSVDLNEMLRTLNKTVPRNRQRAMMQSLGWDWCPALPNGKVTSPVNGQRPKLYVQVGGMWWDQPDANIIIQAYQQANPYTRQRY